MHEKVSLQNNFPLRLHQSPPSQNINECLWLDRQLRLSMVTLVHRVGRKQLCASSLARHPLAFVSENVTYVLKRGLLVSLKFARETSVSRQRPKEP